MRAYPYSADRGAPPTGTAVSGLEEVPDLLRPPHAGPAPRPPGRRPAGAGADVVVTARARRRGPETENPPEAQPDVITDDQAWTVQTPGGGVLTNRTDTPTHQPEPPTALAGS